MLSNPYWLLAIGIVFAGAGGELFVRGVVGLAQAARVSAAIIGATFAAFATSSPELSVSVNSALAGNPEIALGDALGSNVVNIGLILGLALAFAPLQTSRDVLMRDFPVATLAPLLLALLCIDGTIGRADGLLLLGLFSAWLLTVVVEVRRQRSASSSADAPQRYGLAALQSLGGLGFLVGAGLLIVAGAKGVAAQHGLDPFLIGATVVAIGTSAPEIATVLVSRLRGRDEIGLGTILGSNIFNGLFIIGVAATLRPITIVWQEVAIGLGFGLITCVFTLPLRGNTIARHRGLLLIGLYVAYLIVLLQAVPRT